MLIFLAGWLLFDGFLGHFQSLYCTANVDCVDCVDCVRAGEDVLCVALHFFCLGEFVSFDCEHPVPFLFFGRPPVVLPQGLEILEAEADRQGLVDPHIHALPVL